MFKLQEFLSTALDVFSARNYDIAKIMAVAFDQYRYLINPAGKKYEETINFEKEFRKELI